MSGRDYVIEMLGRTLAERDQQIAAEQQANAQLVAENNQLRAELADLKEQ